MITLATSALMLGAGLAQAQQIALLNVSYDPTRELYQEFNAEFAKYWKGKTGQDVVINQSHGGAAKQARRDRWIGGGCRHFGARLRYRCHP